MPQVSSAWQSLLFGQTLDVERQLWVGENNYSDYVLRWPTLRTSWDQIRPNNITINLSNEDQVFNFFIEDKTKLVQDVGFYIAQPTIVESNWITDPTCIQSAVWSDLQRYFVNTDLNAIGDLSTTQQRLIRQRNLAINSESYKLRGRLTWWSESYVNSVYAGFYIRRQSVAGGDNRAWVGFFPNRAITGQNTFTLETRFGTGSFSIPEDSVFFENVVTSGGVLSQRLTFDVDYHYTAAGSCTCTVIPAMGEIVGNSWDTSASDLNSYGMSIVEVELFEATTHPIPIYKGTIDKVSYNDASVALTVSDKFKQLSERVVGTSDVPVNYTGSDYLPSDLAWYLVTSYGGYSAIESNSNPDINYEAFAEWAAVFSNSAILMQAYFDGQKITECLRKIGRMTRSAIHIANNKIDFHRFSLADSNQCDVSPDCIVKFEALIDDDLVVNKQYVFADYAQNSDYFRIVCFDADTPSVNSFGLKEDIEQDKNVWYVNSVSATDLVQRLLLTNGEPYTQVKMTTGAKGLVREVGETVSVNWPHLNIAAGYRIMNQKLDFEKMQATFISDRSQLLPGFILDTSTLDGPDILT